MSNSLFTKSYDVAPNDSQKSALSKAFKVQILHSLTHKETVELKVKLASVHFRNNIDFKKQVVAWLTVNGQPLEKRIIGERGGIKML